MAGTWRVQAHALRLVVLAVGVFGLSEAGGAGTDAVAAVPPGAHLVSASDRVTASPEMALGVHLRLLRAGPQRHSLRPEGAGGPMDWGRRPDPAPDVVLAAPVPAHAPVGTEIRLSFSEPMEPGSVERSFRVAPAIDGRLQWADATTVVFRPSAPLAFHTTYQVNVVGMGTVHAQLATVGRFAFTTAGRPPSVAVPFTLTFDDCGTETAIRTILDVLADRGLHAIFFPTGQCRDQYPWLIPTLLAAGHQVCNHTYSHPVLPRLSSAAVASEIQRGVSAGCNLFRPPYGALDKGGRIAGIAASLGYRIQLWDVDTRDWAGTPADVMDAMIRARGGVVLFHMHGVHTVEALRAL